jgi:hypothetical protein
METTESPKLLTSIIGELQDNNHVNELIFDSVESLNNSLVKESESRTEETAPIFTQILDQITGIHKNIFKFLDIFVGNDLQAEENRRELLEALRGLGKKDKERLPSPLKDDSGIGIGGILGAVIGAAGFLTGMLVGFFGQLSALIIGALKNSKVGKAISSFTSGLVNGIKTLYSNILTSFKNTKAIKAISEFSNSLRTSVSGFFTAIKEGALSRLNASKNALKGVLDKSDMFKGLVSKIKSFYTPFADLLKAIGEFLPKGEGLISGIKGFISSIGTKYTAIANKFSVAFKVGKMFGGLLAKLALPLTIIMGLWDTVTGAIAGYKKDGVEGAIKGGLSGLLNGLVGGILDMIKGGISWIAGALGFKQVEKLLDSFSFSAIIESFVEGLVDFGESIFDLMLAPFTTIPKMLKEALKSISTKGFKGIFEFPKIVLRAVLPDPEKHTSGFDPLYWAAKAIPESIYEYAGMKKPAMKENVVTETTGAVSKAMDSSGVAKETAKQLQKTKGYDTDGDGVLSDAEYLNQLRNEKISGDLGDMKLDYSTPEAATRSDELLKSSNITTNISTPSFERPQNNTGQTLNQSSANTLVAPIVVNNYGGNTTNNTTSRVNNTQAIYDPIVTGSNLNLMAR